MCYTLQAMDGEMYEKSRDVYMLYAQIEADAANLVKAQFEDLREQAYLVSHHMTSHCMSHDLTLHHVTPGEQGLCGGVFLSQEPSSKGQG